jgi:hypothetical protein
VYEFYDFRIPKIDLVSLFARLRVPYFDLHTDERVYVFFSVYVCDRPLSQKVADVKKQTTGKTNMAKSSLNVRGEKTISQYIRN